MARVTKALPKPAHADPDAIVLPNNIEAERSLLGAALCYEQQADYVVDHLVPESFYRRAHRTIFEVIRRLRQQHQGADVVLVKEALGKKQLTEVGGPTYLAGLIDGVPRHTNVAHYADVVKDLQARRLLYEFGRTTIDQVASGEHAAAAMLEDADRRLVELTGGHVKGHTQALSETVPALMDDLQWRVDHRGELIGLETGYPSINDLTSGWQVGDLTILAARPSIGKTTLLLNTAVAGAKALHAAGKSEVVLLFSFEMRRRRLELRLLSHLSGVPLSRIQAGLVLEPEWPAISAALALLQELKIEVDDAAGQTRWQIRSTCRRVQAERGLALVGIDYVQLIPGSLDRRGASRNEELTDISRGLKELCDELSAPILLVSQLNRPTKFFGKDPTPRLTDLRESGSLEQDADNVGLLHRKNHREGGKTLFSLEKQRNAATGTVLLMFDRDTVTFMDAGEQAEEQPAADASGGRERHDLD